ncbi:MAG: hypothetical protein E6J19_11540 [Chloroflexi bacterium]|nr:MAG: hypothetical protein E6J19_11540 [Chloroflexota bacterium]
MTEVLDLLQPFLDRWLLVLLALVLVTFLGNPARNLVGALAGVLRVPAQFTRTDVDPAFRRVTPSAPNRFVRGLRGYLGPVLDRPARNLGRAIVALFATATHAPRWPVAQITDAIVGLVSPLVDQAATHAENGSERLASQVRSAAAELRGRSNRWAGWRIIGGFLFFVGLCLFLYADAALSIASHEKAIGAPVAFLPDWFREITLAYAIASFVGALMLGLVFFDLIGMTHLGPWDDLDAGPRRWLTRIAAGLAVSFLLLALFLALWRASVIVPTFMSADVADKLLGIALTAPIPLMLLATALIAWGAIAMPWLAWILVAGALALAMLLVALVLRAVSRALPPLAILLGGVLRIVGVIALGALIGFLGLAAIAYFGVSVVAAGTLLVLGAAGLALWIASWFAAEALVYAVRLLARVTDASATVIQRVIDVLMYPGKTLWNWIASSDRGRALRLQPITLVETRIVRVTGTEVEPLEEAVR